jgi:NADH:ubiquinone oxidoreductase subunit H
LVRAAASSYSASAVLFFFECLIIILIAAVIHVYSPRFRVDQAFTWFSKFPLIMGVVAIIWAYAIKLLGII